MLGQDIIKIFSAAGHEVIATDREQLNIVDKAIVERVIDEVKPDVIINTAAFNLVDKIEDPEVYPIAFAVNVTGPKNLAEAASDRHIPFVHYSTDYVFAGDKKEGYVETDTPAPISKYGETKYLGEQAVQQAGGAWYILRTSKIFGTPGLTELSKPSFVSLMLKLAAEKPELKIVDEEVGCPTYTLDIAKTTLDVIEEDREPGIYHVVNSGIPVTWYEFAQEIFPIADVSTPRYPVTAATFGPRPAARPKFAALINTKLPPLRSRVDALREFLVKPIVVTEPQMSIVIVSWNVREMLRENLKGLFALSCRHPFEVFVVDNGSEDGSAKMVREDFPQVHLIQNDYNSGFSHACNQGLKRAKGDVLVLFNPDMLMGSGVLDHTYETLTRQRDIGVMGVKLVSPDGQIVESVRRDPGLADQLALLLKVPHLFPKVTERYLAKDFDYTKSQNVDHVRGSFFAFRRDVMEKIGMLDEQYFVWFDEVDYCLRARKAGYRIWYSADASCTDIVGAAFKQIPTRIKQFHFSNSMRKHFRAWHPSWQSLVIASLIPLAVVAGAVHDVWQNSRSNS